MYSQSIVRPVNIFGRKIAPFYNKEKLNYPKVNRVPARQAEKIIQEIWRVTAKMLIEKEGGVVLKYIGYFAHWMCPKKRLFRSYLEKEEFHYNFFTDNYFYYTELFTDIFPASPLRGWCLDRGTRQYIKEDRFRKLKTGFKYKLYLTAIRQLYKKRTNE